jgi:hypothetical protein
MAPVFLFLSHPASAQLLDYAVMRDVLANHCAEMLGLEVGQVNERWEVGWVPGRLVGDKSLLRSIPFNETLISTIVIDLPRAPRREAGLSRVTLIYALSSHS